MSRHETAALALSELAELGDVTSRTVRYYVQAGLLPSPGSGPKARYGRQHLMRIRLIKQLQRRDIPLAKIRAVLEGLDDEGVEQQLASLQAPPDHGTLGRAALGRDSPDPATASAAAPAVDYIRAVLEGRPGLPTPTARYAMPPLDQRLADPDALADPAPAPLPGPPPAQMTRSQWERLPLSPDIELHIRRPLSRHQNKQVDRLIDFVTELFEEDTP
jgi:DNA-binding transcriptional MerR regulator